MEINDTILNEIVTDYVCSQNASGNPLDVFKQDVRGRSSIRVSRLEGLLVLRKIYRNFIRASYLLEQPAPLYEVLQQRFGKHTKMHLCEVIYHFEFQQTCVHITVWELQR